MMHRHLRITGPLAVGLSLALVACGSSGGSGAETTPAPNTTPWRTLAPVAGTDSGGEVEIEGGVVSYKIQGGDYANGIAKKAGGGCSGSELLDFNPDVKVLIPGGILKIPASCLAAGVTEASLNSDDGGDSTDGSTDDETDDESDTTDVPEYNEYIVVSGDYPFGIVEKTGCSFNELKKANGSKFTNPKPKAKLKIPIDCDTREESDSDT